MAAASAGLALTLALGACDSAEPDPQVLSERTDISAIEGLWAGMDASGREQRIACLKIVEPDNSAAFELVEVDTLAGGGSIASANGRWTYAPPRLEIELFGWPDARGVPRISAELGTSGQVLLLRVSYRQGDQFILGLERASRCGQFVG